MKMLETPEISVVGNQTKPRKPYRINYFIIPVFILEVIALACLWALFYYLRFESVFPYHKRVFKCKDPALAYPNFLTTDVLWRVYVSQELLLGICFTVPPLVIVVGETMFWLFSTKPRKTVRANCYECNVHLFTRRTCRFISVFMFGALLTCIFIDTIKIITGYQRPYFLKFCQVNISSCAADPFEFSLQESQSSCLNRQSETEYRKASTSFPSLYAGLSFFSAIFTSLYIHFMISLRGAPLLRPFLIAAFVGMAVVASFSRIQGYKNHWRDVWVGWIIGTVIAVWLCYNVLCFQEVYHVIIPRPVHSTATASTAMDEKQKVAVVEERVSPFFSWFRLPRVQAPSRKDSVYSVYTDGSPEPQVRQRNGGGAGREIGNRTYEVNYHK